ncbi:universal stress protein [Thalassobacillus sp. C254]|uniref:universal stress protein n=1 Tax=Thalassobacillus sp. C254 TaxID=1225341 RepID=UPI00277D1201|nr:universal stress protein [Thalassobacillus sp. C254]
MYNHILLAADGSDHAFRAGKQAAQLAKASGGKVDVVYVVDGETSKADNLNHSYQYVLEKKEEKS